MAQQDWPHKAVHETNNSYRVRQRFQFHVRQHARLYMLPEPCGDGFRPLGGTNSADDLPQRWIHDGPRDDYSEKLAIVPHVFHFEIDQLQDLVLYIRCQRQFSAKINNFLGDLETNEREQQTRLALEITMDEAFGAIGGSSNFTSCGGLVAARGEKFACCRNQRRLTRSPISCSTVGNPGAVHTSKKQIVVTGSSFGPGAFGNLALFRQSKDGSLVYSDSPSRCHENVTSVKLLSSFYV